MAREYQIGALWIGGDLSYLEQLCLKSFADAGQAVTLFTYEPVGNVPAGVKVADAAAVLPAKDFLRHGLTQSPALHSDLFRYHLLQQQDRMIWADTDAYCVKPFTTETGHFHGWESNTYVNGGVLGLPQDSATLAGLLEFTKDEYPAPEWYPPDEMKRIRVARESGSPLHVSELRWGVWGPHAITHFLHATGEIRHALPRAALYPFAFHEKRRMLWAKLDRAKYITDETFSIHFYSRRIKRFLVRKCGGLPLPESLMGSLLDKHGIDPRLAPIPLRDGDVPDDDGAGD